MRIAILLGTALVLSGCGASKGLAPPKGEALPPAPYGTTARPTATDLLKPSNQARPERSDELLKSSEDRRSDEFDLPPPN
jgi:hypothetical protein